MRNAESTTYFHHAISPERLCLGLLFHVRRRHGNSSCQPALSALSASLGTAAQPYHADFRDLYAGCADQPAVSGPADQPLWISQGAASGPDRDDRRRHRLGPVMECLESGRIPIHHRARLGSCHHLGLHRHDSAQQQGRPAACGSHHKSDDCLRLRPGARGGRIDGAMGAIPSGQQLPAADCTELFGYLCTVQDPAACGPCKHSQNFQPETP